jgi:hypothetical protein
MPSSGMWRRVALVKMDVSEEHSASFIRVGRISEIETRATRRHISEDGIFRSHRRENCKSYMNKVALRVFPP